MFSFLIGQPGWYNSSWYINGTLIPNLVVRVGQSYTFHVRGGDDPNKLNYHPFYITNSKSGGYLQKQPEEQEVISS